MGWGRLQIFGILTACVAILIVELLNEKNKLSLSMLNEMKTPVRWFVYYIAMMWMVIVFVQLYGISQNTGFIYAKF